MTNITAAVLALLIIAALILDYAANGSSATLFLARRFMDLIQALAFWR